MTLFYTDTADRDEEARRDAIDERRRAARMNHWCEDCRGHSGGPCDFGDDEPEPEEETDFCLGCSDEPTINELEDGRCDACGKYLQ